MAAVVIFVFMQKHQRAGRRRVRGRLMPVQAMRRHPMIAIALFGFLRGLRGRK